MTIASEDARFQVRLGARIRSKRTDAGKFLTEGGKAVGVSMSQMSRYELGEAPVSPASLVRLARLYKCEVGDFFDGLAIR